DPAARGLLRPRSPFRRLFWVNGLACVTSMAEPKEQAAKLGRKDRLDEKNTRITAGMTEAYLLSLIELHPLLKGQRVIISQ
ncbi:hypothetical protein FRC16_007172, partial [Serendipita sp. 398]